MLQFLTDNQIIINLYPFPPKQSFSIIIIIIYYPTTRPNFLIKIIIGRLISNYYYYIVSSQNTLITNYFNFVNRYYLWESNNEINDCMCPFFVLYRLCCLTARHHNTIIKKFFIWPNYNLLLSYYHTLFCKSIKLIITETCYDSSDYYCVTVC